MIDLPLNWAEVKDLDKNSLYLATLKLYERALGATRCGVAIADVRQPDSPLIYCNRAFETMTGYRREEILGRNCRFLQGPDTDRATIEQMRTALAEGQECQVIVKNYRKDGTPFWNELILSPVRDEWGELAYYVGIQTDVTQQQKNQELQRLMQFSIDRAGDAAFYFSREGEILYVNQAACDLLGYSKEELSSLSLHQIVPHYSPQTWEQNPQHQDALTFESETRTRDGETIPVEITTSSLPFNGQEYHCAFVRDIRDRKRTEANLRSRIKRGKLVAKIANRIRQAFDLDGVLNTAVQEVRHVLQTDRVLLYRFQSDWGGQAVVESVGEGWKSVLGSNIQDNCFQETYAPLYQRGRLRVVGDIYKAGLAPCHLALLEQFQVQANLVVPIRQKDGLWGLLIVHHCAEPRHWEKWEIELLRQLSLQLAIAIGQAALFESLERELKERSRAEAALRQSEAQLKQALRELQQTHTQLVHTEKMSSLGGLVAGVAHEINNPLSFIDGNLTFASQYAQSLLELLQLYRQHYPHPTPAIQTKAQEIDCDFIEQDFLELLSSMKTGTERIEKIVQSLRNFSRLDEAKRKSVDLHEGIDNTLLLLQNQLKQNKPPIQIVKNYGQLPWVECHPGSINQVFMNLIVNAIDALGEIKNNSSQPPTISIQTETKNNRVIIWIEDNGPGIPKPIQPHIFDPFFSTKPVGQGTGLGLSVSYQIVALQHKGQLSCCSQSGRGATFRIEIPVRIGLEA